MRGLGKAIRAVRKSRTITQSALSEKIGCKKNYISRIENELSGISKSHLKTVADALDFPVGAIILLAIEPTDFPEKDRHVYERLLQEVIKPIELEYDLKITRYE